MGFFKRLSLFVFALAGLAALAALVAPWYGPVTADATRLLGVQWYLTALQVALCITVLGLVVCLLRALFVRNRKTVVVAREAGDQVTVSIDAIASQATHVIEEDGLFRARRVSVRAAARGHVRVHARVQPTSTVDVLLAASELHERLEEGLAVIVGDNVDKIDLEFVNAAEYAPAAEAASFNEQDADDADADAEAAAPAPASAAQPAPSDTSEITVPMGRSAAEREDDTETMGEE